MASIVRIALPGLLFALPSNALACDMDGIADHRFFAFANTYAQPADPVAQLPDARSNRSAPEPQAAEPSIEPEPQQYTPATEPEQGSETPTETVITR